MKLLTFAAIGTFILISSAIMMFDFYVTQQEKAHEITCKYFGGESETEFHYTLFLKDGGLTRCKLYENEKYYIVYSALQEITDYPSAIALAGSFILNSAMFIMFIYGLSEVKP